MLFLLLAAAAAVPPPPVPAVSTTLCLGDECSGLTARDVLLLAQRRLAGADLAGAKALLTQVLQDRVPEYRAEARFQLAKLAEATGDRAGAERWYRALLDEQPSAAVPRIELGRLLIARGNREGAAREFRRAQAIGLPPEVARIVARYTDALRDEQPLTGGVEIAIAPDSNINRATRARFVEALGLPFRLDDAARERPGIGVTLQTRTIASMPLGPHRLAATLRTVGNFYRRKDASQLNVELALGPELRLGGGTALRLAGTTRRSWQGGTAVTRAHGAAATLRSPIGDTSALSATLTGERREHLLLPVASGWDFALDVALDKALSPRLYARAGLSVVRTGAQAAPLAAWGYGANLVLSRQLGPLTLYGGGSYSRLDGDAPYFLFGRARRDVTVEGNAGVVLRPFAIAGLAPVIRYNFTRNFSPIALHAYRRSRVQIGATREF